jgi:capsid protein
MSNMEVNRGHMNRRKRILAPALQAMYECVLEEHVMKNPGDMPGTRSFWDARDEICGAHWIGPPMPIADPVKEAAASQARLDAMTTSLSIECARHGIDWVELLEQRKREQELIAKLGINVPKPVPLQVDGMEPEPPPPAPPSPGGKPKPNGDGR